MTTDSNLARGTNNTNSFLKEQISQRFKINRAPTCVCSPPSDELYPGPDDMTDIWNLSPLNGGPDPTREARCYQGASLYLYQSIAPCIGHMESNVSWARLLGSCWTSPLHHAYQRETRHPDGMNETQLDSSQQLGRVYRFQRQHKERRLADPGSRQRPPRCPAKQTQLLTYTSVTGWFVEIGCCEYSRPVSVVRPEQTATSTEQQRQLLWNGRTAFSHSHHDHLM